MLRVSSSTGGKSVIASGLGITYSRDADYRLKLEFEDGFSFEVKLKFGADDPDGQPSIWTSTDESSRIITVECRNVDDFIGTGTTSPIELATYHGRKVNFNFWVRTPDSGSNREVRYCFYLEG